MTIAFFPAFCFRSFDDVAVHFKLASSEVKDSNEAVGISVVFLIGGRSTATTVDWELWYM